MTNPTDSPDASGQAELTSVDDAAVDDASTTAPTATGPRRLLAVIYGVFTVAALSRAGVQMATKFGHAPLAYTLSLLAGLIYLAATIGISTTRKWSRPLALASLSIELVGVLAVGALSLWDSAAFPDDTVWSRFGSGYVFIPLVLPIVGLLWLLRGKRGKD